MPFKFSKKDFSDLEVPDLILNDFDWRKPNCMVCMQYCNYCIELAREQWQVEFVDFDFFN